MGKRVRIPRSLHNPPMQQQFWGWLRSSVLLPCLLRNLTPLVYLFSPSWLLLTHEGCLPMTSTDCLRRFKYYLLSCPSASSPHTKCPVWCFNGEDAIVWESYIISVILSIATHLWTTYRLNLLGSLLLWSCSLWPEGRSSGVLSFVWEAPRETDSRGLLGRQLSRQSLWTRA